jgi:Uma2 family endonuclease
MELSVETITEKILSPYEIERGKPMPTLIHGSIQFNIGFELKSKYPKQFRIANEVSLATQPDWSTPDVVLYPNSKLDFDNDPARRTDAPLLSIEIQSPSQSTKDMTSKLEPYFSFGIKSCWIIVPEFRAVFVYDNPFHYAFFHESDIIIDKIIGIEIPITKVFE